MEIAYLGLFQDVCDWVLAHIMQPIYEWLSSLLTSVLTWVFQEIFQPFLEPILEKAIEFFIELWLDIYSVFLYTGFSAILKLIDYIETAFDIFIGLRDVSFTQGGDTITGSLLEVLLQMDTINKIFWAFTLSGLGIAMILTIYATAKSAFDLDFENRRPVSKVLASMMKTFITFFTVPFFMYFIIQLATVVLEGVSYVLGSANKASLGRIVFTIASLDAAADIKNDNDVITRYASPYNISTAVTDPDLSTYIPLGTSEKDIYRYPFYTGAKDYADISAVSKWFDLSNFDYLIGFIAAIFLLVVLAMCLLTFVQRIFEVILLYAVSPYFVSMIPIDEGERFGRWRDMFISKVLTGFGSVMGMRLYLMVCPMIMGNQIQFGSYVSVDMDYIMKLFFLIGGAWAIYKSGPMITSLFSYSAGQREAAVSDMVGGYFYGHTVGKAMSAGKQYLKGAVGKGAGGKGNTGKSASAVGKTAGTETAKFNGSKPLSSATGSKSSLKTNTWVSGTKPQGERSQKKITIGAKRKPASEGGSTVNRTANEQQPQTMQTNHNESQQREKSNIRLGSLFQSTYDKNGNHKIRVLGIGTTRDANGNTTSVKLPGMKLRKTEADSSYKVSKLHIPGVAKVKSNVSNGELKYSDISVLGMRYQRNEQGSSFGIGNSFRISKDGEGNVNEVKVGKVHTYQHGEQRGFDLGSKFSYRKSESGSGIRYGNSINVQKSKETGKISNLQIGSLTFSKTGTITKSTNSNGKEGESK